MAVRTGYIVLDANDIEGVAAFWAGLFGVGVAERFADGQYVVLEPSAEGQPPLSFQRVPEPRTVKNRMHLDLEVDDFETTTAWITEHGGRWVDGIDHELDGYRWRCMADPEGNEFDLVPV